MSFSTQPSAESLPDQIQPLCVEPPPQESLSNAALKEEPSAITRPFHAQKSGLLHSLQSIVYIIVVAIFIITFCVQPFRIPSSSMEPTLLVGDFLLVDKQSPIADSVSGLLPSTTIHRGDIIVFYYPVDPSMYLVKRVVGVPGDHLKLRDGHVFIDGQPLQENYAVYRPSPPDNFRDNFPRLQSADPAIDSRWWIRMRTLVDDGELIIPAGNYFVLGDNRNDSEDSRYWGFVPRAAIIGRPLVIYFSLRQPSPDPSPLTTTADAATPHRLHPGRFDALAGIARWGRTFQVVK